VDCGGSCVSCAEKNVNQLIIGPAILFSHERTFTAVAPITNPNKDFGTESFGYVVDFYDETGTLLKSVESKDFIYPGENKNIIDAGTKITNGVPNRVEIKIIRPENIVWKHKDDFFFPSYSLKESLAEVEKDQLVISGFVLNEDNFAFSKVVVGAFAIDNIGIKVGASETNLGSLNQFENKSFRIFIPLTKSLQEIIDLELVKNSVSVDVLK